MFPSDSWTVPTSNRNALMARLAGAPDDIATRVSLYRDLLDADKKRDKFILQGWVGF